MILLSYSGSVEEQVDWFIAVIDDMESSLQLTEYNLAAAGYHSVVTFKDPKAVLEHIRQGHIPRLIITDFQMPEMNGLELLDTATRLCPSIQGLIVTGCPELVGNTGDRFPVLGKGDKDFFRNLVDQVSHLLPVSTA